ncbi:MAG: Uma2 family endonuclease [Cyanosarcina radialis HA8281-LM2]|jgi:Uma2 family endonuclease|nr:Uma2 family endonuclease [Cyanosarcina radialis HA8281-LM2]
MTITLETKTQDRCLILPGISWSQLEAIDAALADVGGIRLFYLDGMLEIMTIGEGHEEAKSTIGLLLEAYMRQKDIRFYVKGRPTLGGREQNARKEPDESYNLQTKKSIPDLAIEVIFTSGGLDKLEFYKRLGVPEVWFWEDGVLAIYHLSGDYRRVDRSVLLPELDLALLVRYITYHDQYDAITEFIKALREE